MLARLLLIGAILCTSAPGAAQDDLYVPKPPDSSEEPAPKPAPIKPPKPSAATMAGDWHTVTKGSMICSFGTGTITIDSNGVTGFSDVGGFPGAVKLRFSPPSVYLTYNYTDSLGNDDALAIYEGILSADKNTVTGTVGGTWEDNCTFTMRRR